MKELFTACTAATLVLAAIASSATALGKGEEGGAKPSIVDPAALAVPEQQSRSWAEELRDMLTRQLDILTGIQSSASAQAALEPLRACMADMKAMKTRVNEEALWIYIDNTPDVKQPFIELLLRTSGEFLRLNTEQFYGCDALREALKPQMVAEPSSR